MTAAMKSRDAVVLRTTRSVIAAVQEAQVAGPSATTLSDDEVEKVIRAQAKRRVEAAEAFETGDRPERAAAERAELVILEAYLPKGLGEHELGELVNATLESGGFSTMADMGAAMKAVNAEVSGRADGRVVAALVKGRLSG